MHTWNLDRYLHAWHFATQYHHGQTYGGPSEGVQINYLNHLGCVATEVIWALPSLPHANGDLAVQCALLHDVIEDTTASYELVEETFGVAVAQGVLALTKNANLPSKAAQMADSLERIRQQPPEIWIVKLADRITNLHHPPHYWDQAKIEAYRQEALTIYAALHTASEGLAKRLAEQIVAYERFLRREGVE
jgi:(p)ppGpp synthase/HD superfamily hydrolase